jgi:hypothetical protein
MLSSPVQSSHCASGPSLYSGCFIGKCTSRHKAKRGEKKPLTKPDNPGGKQNPKREHDVHVRGTIHTNLSPDEEKRHNAERREDTTAHHTEREEDRARETHKVWLERFTLLAVVIYAGITYWQGTMTRESIDNNSKQFQIDQRPYVWALEYTPTKNVHIAANEAMWINIAWVNHGKSPAVRAMCTGKIFVGKDAMQEADKWFASLGTGQLPSQPTAETIIPPGIPSDLDKPLGGYSTILTDHPLKQEEVDYILNTEEPVAMVLRMQYYDLFGNRYWSDLCLSRYKLGSYPHCTLHNEMH